MPNIAIVGAGVSGLRCADVLIRSGARVTIYEARNRVGGRLHQQSSGGHVMDMGPNWIHGSKDNPIVRLARQTGTAVMDPPEVTSIFDSSGHRLPHDLAEEISENMWSTIASAFEYSNKNSTEIDRQTSLYDYMVSTCTAQVTDREKLQLIFNESQTWGGFVGDPIERQSLKFFFLEETIDGENVFVASTYKAILDELARTAISHDIIKFDTEITHFTSFNDSVQLTNSTGTTYLHDEVVLTCPLGWLKHHHKTAFTPPLAPRLSAAISNISYGRLEKLYVTFPSAFWLAECPNSTERDVDSYPCVTSFHSPTYHPLPDFETSGSKCWNQSLLSLSHLPSPNAHPTLLFYLHGPCSTFLVSSIKDLIPHSAEYNETLRSFAEPFYSRLPNFDATKSECVPRSFMATTWQNDKWAGNGSYCNFQIGLEDGDEDIRVLRDAGGMGRFGTGEALVGGDGSMSRPIDVNGDISTDRVTNTITSGPSSGTVIATKAMQTPPIPTDILKSLQASSNTEPAHASTHAGQSSQTPPPSASNHLETDTGPRAGGIHLCGEHTSPFVALGTTTGAYWSGEGVARRICGKWGIECAVDE